MKKIYQQPEMWMEEAMLEQMFATSLTDFDDTLGTDDLDGDDALVVEDLVEWNDLLAD